MPWWQRIGFHGLEMRAGALRHKVTIQKLDGTLDDAGVENQTWVDVVEAWAAIEPLSGTEKPIADQEVAQANVRVRTRFLDLGLDAVNVRPKMRVTFVDRSQNPDLTRLYDILAIVNKNMRFRETHFLCKENV